MTYKNKSAVGAQCNSLQQFLSLCIMFPFIHFSFKLINLIFSIFLKWKFPSGMTSITQNSLLFHCYGFQARMAISERNSANADMPLLYAAVFSVLLLSHSYSYPIPIQSCCILSMFSRGVCFSPLHPVFSS